MSPLYIADLALEYWRASGVRSLERLEHMVVWAAETEYGHGTARTLEEIPSAQRLAVAKVRSWELQTSRKTA